MPLTCDACGAEVLDIDVKCGACGHHLTATGAHEMIGGVVLGQYEITDVLGQGGMSVVYKGRHQLTEQEVALKILPPELAAHSQVKSRFVEEAKALAALDHPNIVHLYNFGQEGASFVLAMQFVRGTTFERMILEADQLHWGLAAGVCIDVLKALEYAHSRGVIHRDMKPSNILVREDDGSATVMDFGIAKMTTSTRLTATGQTMGTVRYMSPEQVRGLSVDVTTDIYSLGATLYEALVGDTPFDGETHFEIMTKHLSEPPVPPSAHGVVVPGAMERALMRSLAKKPEERFASARDFRDALEKALEAGDLGEAETLRMTRDLVLSLPRGPGQEDDSGSDAGAGTPTADAPVAAADDDEIPLDVPARKPVLWIALAGLVAVASVVVAVVLISGRDSTAGGPVSKSEAGPVKPTAVAPFTVPGVSYAVDESFPADRLRVMAVAPIDPGEVRAAYSESLARFDAFLRERGHPEPLAREPITLQLVTPEVMCRREIYRDPARAAECAGYDGWYRPTERTLLLNLGDRPLSAMALNVARAMCVQQKISLCDAKLLDDFTERVAPAGGQDDEN